MNAQYGYTPIGGYEYYPPFLNIKLEENDVTFTIRGEETPREGGGVIVGQTLSVSIPKEEAKAIFANALEKLPAISDDQIKHMVQRFLMWRLPETFSPDAGISFKADFNEGTRWPMKHKPMGTNLFDAKEAEAMIRHLVEDMPTG